MIEERQAAREDQLRKEREEREAVRAEKEREFQFQIAERQSAQDTQNQQLMMLFMVEIFGEVMPSQTSPAEPVASPRFESH
ncbi:hypothetical protein F441_06896 [Phytophthora nicotianae CJ01A1]|uniref:Uncharacterized protein n=5 Tax=Phytophthora nicotianae TaxID=4792 RepID=V9FFJ4_PHYNI|nr:hypothetical protein F443_06897 [Phytophthora nicotianae P1569]ETK89077.1 hypothetical protein L915_06770 [Phytophthora nicotianae]ETO77916.1 hypothetical protein F444_06964 [Phytophthora nicotianae P1976]ETP18959.1 hypothetical protein F441_06896 [Phytophthora nicotianae CJ01A1]ETP46900.1 hypothetical protein F442_06933 [Phytophthora nicotianae P10297]